MLTVVINAPVQQEEMVTVITCFYYVFELTEFPMQELECAQLPTAAQTLDLGYKP